MPASGPTNQWGSSRSEISPDGRSTASEACKGSNGLKFGMGGQAPGLCGVDGGGDVGTGTPEVCCFLSWLGDLPLCLLSKCLWR